MPAGELVRAAAQAVAVLLFSTGYTEFGSLFGPRAVADAVLPCSAGSPTARSSSALQFTRRLTRRTGRTLRSRVRPESNLDHKLRMVRRASGPHGRES